MTAESAVDAQYEPPGHGVGALRPATQNAPGWHVACVARNDASTQK